MTGAPAHEEQGEDANERNHLESHQRQPQGEAPAATRSPTANMPRSAGKGIGTPAFIGDEKSEAKRPSQASTYNSDRLT